MPKKGLKKGKKGKKGHKKSTKKGKKASASGDTGSAANEVSTRLQPSAHYQDVCDPSYECPFSFSLRDFTHFYLFW